VRLVGSVAAVLVGIAAISAVVWLYRYSPWAERYPDRRITRVTESEPVSSRMRREELQKAAAAKKQSKSAVASEPTRPPLVDKAPFPKTVVAEQKHDFGAIETGEPRKHAFRIENKGDAPLILADQIGWRREVPPGGSTEFEMNVQAFQSTPTLAKKWTIWTNDPKLPEIAFEVDARVVADVWIEPSGEWRVRIQGDQDGKLTGKIGSQIEPSFKINSVEPSTRQVKVDYRPLDAKELSHDHLKSGYAINVTVSKEIPLGLFQADIKFRTTLKEGDLIDIRLTALQLR
jgi:Protein of unknown function (DUF1573)